MQFLSYPLPHFDERSPGVVVDTIVLHCMFRSASLFPFDPQACLASLDANKVSAHYTIDRLGEVYQSVAESNRAWHAGKSFLPEKKAERVNDFSIGIELIAKPDGQATRRQTKQLLQLLREITSRHPIKYIVGHEYIAPERKVDPGTSVSWSVIADAFPQLCVPQAR